MQSLLALGSASIKIASISTIHMSWISGNLNELEDPIAKVNSWYYKYYSHTKFHPILRGSPAKFC